ncbi:MAG: hypothetical protein RDA78_25525 [Roseibium sp.]
MGLVLLGHTCVNAKRRLDFALAFLQLAECKKGVYVLGVQFDSIAELEAGLCQLAFLNKFKAPFVVLFSPFF